MLSEKIEKALRPENTAEMAMAMDGRGGDSVLALPSTQEIGFLLARREREGQQQGYEQAWREARAQIETVRSLSLNEGCWVGLSLTAERLAELVDLAANKRGVTRVRLHALLESFSQEVRAAATTYATVR